MKKVAPPNEWCSHFATFILPVCVGLSITDQVMVQVALRN